MHTYTHIYTHKLHTTETTQKSIVEASFLPSRGVKLEKFTLLSTAELSQ